VALVTAWRRSSPSAPGRSEGASLSLQRQAQAALDALDHAASGMERKWGVGRLRLLVHDGLRVRFDAQKEKLDAAIASGEPAYLLAHAQGMRRAWLALDQAAETAGAAPLSPEIWECVLPTSGEAVALVRTEIEAHHLARYRQVFTVAEVARLIEALGEGVLEVKRVFPGAAVVEVRRRPAEEEGADAPF
jgi:hypothetical protein